MPRIFDNIELALLPALRQTLELADRADFCAGYFNLRLPEDDLREWLGVVRRDEELDNSTAAKLRRQLAAEFRTQLTVGIPTDADEAALRKLASQIRSRKVVVKLHLRHPLHAKLYLLFRPDPINPIVGFLGSSN